LTNEETAELSEFSATETECSFVFKSISRNDFYEAHRNKDKVPPCGTYNPDFRRIDKRLPIPDLNHSKEMIRIRPEEVPDPGSYEMPDSISFPRKIVQFSNLGRRKPLADPKRGPNEKRFHNSHGQLVTSFCTKYERIHDIHFEKY
jgi:hypothetical protein